MSSETSVPDDVLNMWCCRLRAIIVNCDDVVPGLDPENCARVIQWAQDNINEMKLLKVDVHE